MLSRNTAQPFKVHVQHSQCRVCLGILPNCSACATLPLQLQQSPTPGLQYSVHWSTSLTAWLANTATPVVSAEPRACSPDLVAFLLYAHTSSAMMGMATPSVAVCRGRQVTTSSPTATTGLASFCPVWTVPNTSCGSCMFCVHDVNPSVGSACARMCTPAQCHNSEIAHIFFHCGPAARTFQA